MLNKLNLNHSIIFLIFCLVLVSLDYFRLNTLLYTCLFLVLTIGISHGSLDNLKGKKLLQLYNINNMAYFYLGYVFLSLFVIIFWLFFPSLLLILFLIIASYHFGKEDSEFLYISKGLFFDILFFLKGSIVISAPLIFQKSKTLEIFNTIGMNTELIIFSSDLLVIIFILLSILSSFIIVSSVRNLYALVLVLDLMAILVLNYFLQPLLAFTLYFCFLHSIRHSISLMYELDNNLTKSIPIFFKKSLPLTLLTGFLFVIIFILLMGEFDVSNSINKVIFIGLAALTLPHITLEYILEKKAEI
ncbi:MAG: hypothetical protein CML98_07090 [Rhodobiaceae bacterium]|nr:hypothetical protein [Rhodobiaceae bacterium]